MSEHHQARLCVSHVCHQWREIAINQPLLWSHVDFATLSSAGATEILARAKPAPLYLEARVPSPNDLRWDEARFSTFQKDLQVHVLDACHLSISAVPLDLYEILGELVSPAPTLEHLSLFSCRERYDVTEPGDHLFIPHTFFNGSAPRLSCLKLNCEISWKSPLLKGLRHLEIRSPLARPKLAAWLDTLDTMSRLETLILHSASPITPRDDINHIATLPSLTHLDILDSPVDCALALAHLDLPALTRLNITVAFLSRNSDIQAFLPHLVRHAHGPQDTQPLQSMLICNEDNRASILAWTLPDIDTLVQDPPTFLATTVPSPRVAVFFTWSDSSFAGDVDVQYEATAALPLSDLVTLIAQDIDSHRVTRFWLRLEPKWPLLHRAQLAGHAQQGFINMLLEGNDESHPLLPLLTEIVLIKTMSHDWICADWTSALRKRVKQGVPLQRLDLRTFAKRSRPDQVQSLS